MSGTMPALRWERGRDAYGRELWKGHSGAEWIAWVWPHVAPGVCRWSLTLDSDGPLGDGGDAPTLDAAKADAQAAWAAWCVSAGLDPAGEVQRLRDALLDALAVFDIGEGTRFRDAHRDVIERAQAAVGREAVRDAAAPGAVP